MSVDPLAEDYAAWSPYNYVLGNPVMMVDPDGRSPEKVDGDYFDTNGNHLGNDGEDDNKIYVRDESGDTSFGVGVLAGGSNFSEISMDSELGTLARAVYAEGGSESYEGKVVIAEVIRNRTLLADQRFGYPEGGKTYSEVISSIRKTTDEGKKLHQFQFMDEGNSRKSVFENPSSQFKKHGEKQAFLDSVSASLKMHNGKTNLGKGASFFWHSGKGMKSSQLESVTPPKGSKFSALKRYKNFKTLFNDTSYFK